MRRTGFTLIELLLVIAIIAVLAAILVPVIGIAKRASKEAKCRTQLANISAAIARYKDVNGTIPEKDPAPGRDRYGDAFKSGSTYKTVDQISSSDWQNVADALLEQLQTVDRDTFRDPSSLRDPFTGGPTATNVFRYRPSKFYPAVEVDAQGRAKGKLIDGYGKLAADGSELPPNPESYQLWSTGFDGKDQFGERVDGKKSDDITNWKSN